MHAREKVYELAIPSDLVLWISSAHTHSGNLPWSSNHPSPWPETSSGSLGVEPATLQVPETFTGHIDLADNNEERKCTEMHPSSINTYM